MAKIQEPHRIPVQNEPEFSKTEKVQQRLALAEEAAKAGNPIAALNYANAAFKIQQTGTGPASTLAKIEDIARQYGNAIPNPIYNAPTPPNGGGSGGNNEISYGSPQVYYSAPPPPAPLLPQFKGLSTSSLAIKQAPIDTIVFNDDLIDIENMTELLYENIAGLELANISREDLINGQEVVYSPIANLSAIYKLFNPNNIIATSSTLQTYFSRFAIDLILRGMNEPYIDSSTGNLIVAIDSILEEEEVQLQIASSGTIELVDQ